MPDFSLASQSPLDGLNRSHGDITLSEPPGLALVSVATPLGGHEILSAALVSAFGATLPRAGASTTSEDGTVRFLGLQSDQAFALFKYAGDDPRATIAGQLGEAGYYTDQSDSWAMLRLSGAGSLIALQRLCMLDLDPREFPAGAVARTAMEHLAVIILREGDDAFLLMSPRSSANSFLHAVETAILNTT